MRFFFQKSSPEPFDDELDEEFEELLELELLEELDELLELELLEELDELLELELDEEFEELLELELLEEFDATCVTPCGLTVISWLVKGATSGGTAAWDNGVPIKAAPASA